MPKPTINRRSAGTDGIAAVAIIASMLVTGRPGASAVAGPGTASPSPRATSSVTPRMATDRPDAARQTLRHRLERIPGMRVTQVERVSPKVTYFHLRYRQPKDHRRPAGQTFPQRLTILHVGTRRPTVLETTGYTLIPFPYTTEPTRLLRANQVTTEQRFFPPSRPKPADWSKVTIWQAAADHHRPITALKPIYTGRWISTGVSMGGMTTTYHRRFFPHDVAGSVAYVAPNDVHNFKDRYLPFINHAGADPTCNRKLRVVQRQALMRRDALVPMVRQENRRQGNTVRQTVGTWGPVLRGHRRRHALPVLAVLRRVVLRPDPRSRRDRSRGL